MSRSTKRVLEQISQIRNVDLRWNDIQMAYRDAQRIIKDQKILTATVSNSHVTNELVASTKLKKLVVISW